MDETRKQDEPRERGEETALLVDCGQASQATRGVPYQLAFEQGWPPNNRMYYS